MTWVNLLSMEFVFLLSNNENSKRKGSLYESDPFYEDIYYSVCSFSTLSFWVKLTILLRIFSCVHLQHMNFHSTPYTQTQPYALFNSSLHTIQNDIIRNIIFIFKQTAPENVTASQMVIGLSVRKIKEMWYTTEGAVCSEMAPCRAKNRIVINWSLMEIEVFIETFDRQQWLSWLPE